MPIYEYECQKCGNQTEVWQKFSDAPLTKCEKCKGKLRKLISQNSFHLKGSGWYATDYASKSSTLSGKKAKTPDHDQVQGKPVENKNADSGSKKKE